MFDLRGRGATIQHTVPPPTHKLFSAPLMYAMILELQQGILREQAVLLSRSVLYN
jgi:hypothetical protein